MSNRFRAVLCVICVGMPPCLTSVARAQDDAMPRISAVHPGADALRVDLEYMLKLTSEREQKQWANLNDFLETFLGGVDTKRPIRADAQFSGGEVRYRPAFPVSDIADFLENIEYLGIITDRDRRDRGLYKAEELFEGYLRYKDAYGTFGFGKEDVPKDLPSPVKAIESLLKRKYNLGLELVNNDVSAAAQEKRVKAIRDANENILAAMSKRPDQSALDFEIGKTVARHQLGEFERIFVQTERFFTGARIDKSRGRADFDFDFKPIGGTDLEKSVKLFNKAPSRFANIPQSERSVLSIRVNHPMDDLRKRNLAELYELLAKNAADRVDRSDTLSGSEQAATKEVINLLKAFTLAANKSGLLDAYVEVERLPGGQHRLCAGIVAPDADKVVAILEKLPAARKGQEAEIDVDKVGDFRIHRLRMVRDKQKVFNGFIGQHPDSFIATGPKAVWYAIGDNAVAELKRHIKLVEKENQGVAEDPLFQAHVRLTSWVELLQLLADNRPEPKTEEEKQAAADGENYRKTALAAFRGGDDVMEGKIHRKGEHINGRMSLDTGLLRVVGKLMAQFSEDQLEIEN